MTIPAVVEGVITGVEMVIAWLEANPSEVATVKKWIQGKEVTEAEAVQAARSAANVAVDAYQAEVDKEGKP